MAEKNKKTSVWKVLLKVSAWILSIVLVLVIALVLIAEFANDKVVKLALPSVGKIIEAPVSIGQTSLSFIRAFPYATLELDDVYLGSTTRDTVHNDSLVKVDKIYVSLMSEPLMNGIIEIKEVEFKGATLKYLVDSTGSTCFDFLMGGVQDSLVKEELVDEGVDTTGTSISIDLEKLTISDITCYYSDRQLGARAKAYIPQITAKGALSDSLIRAQVKGSIQVTNVDFDSTNARLLNMAELKLDVDYEGEDISVNKVTLALDDIVFDVTGTARLSDGLYTDVHLACDKIDVADVVKFAPDGMLGELGIDKVEGNLRFSADVKGDLTDTTRYPHVDANLGFSKGLIEMAGYPQVKNIALDMDVTTGDLGTDESIALNLKNLHFETAKSSGTISLTAGNLNLPHYNVNAKFHVATSEVAPYIPTDLGISKIKGNVDLSLSTKGVYTGDINNAFIEKALRNTSAQLRLNQFSVAMDSVVNIDTLNLNLAYSNYGVKISKTNVSLPDFGLSLKNFGTSLTLKGDIFDMSKMAVDIDKFHVEVADSKVDLDAKVRNLEMPTYEAQLGVDVNIDNFRQYFPDSLAHSINGGIGLNVKSHGTVNLDSIESQIYDIVINNTDIALNLNDITADMYDPFINFSNLAGNISLANDSLKIDDFGVEWQGLRLHIDSTVIANALKIFVLEETDNKLDVLAKVSLDDFDYDWVGQMFPADSAKSDSIKADSALAVAEIPAGVAQDTTATADTAKPYSFLDLGYPVEVRGMFKLGHLQYEKASIDSISAKFSVNDTVVVIEDFKLGAFGGDLKTSARVKFKSAEHMVASFRTNLSQMDLNKLLVDFDNFDQTDITSDNLSGQLTADVDGYAEVQFVGDSVNVPLNKVKLLGNIRLDNGSIVDLEMLKQLDKYVNMHELSNIQFDTLKTSIFVRNGSFYLPQTDIKTSAMNISAFAMQGIDNKDFEYHIKIFPGEIMLGNSKSVMKKQSQMKDNLADEDNLKSINLLAYNIDGESKYWFDNTNRKKKMRTKIKVQQKQLELGFSPRLVKYNTGVKFR